MASYKGKRKSEKDVKESRKSNPENGKNNLHLDKEEKESIPKSKSGLTSSELAILKNVIADGLFSEMKMPMADGSKYQGERYKGQKHGQGILILPNGERYEGQFANDQAHGEGVYTWPDGVRSEGEFREGTPWSVVGYDEHGEICGLIIDGKYQEVYTDSHRCATQARYQEEKVTNILTSNRR